MPSSEQLFEMGLPLIGVPKTIDNDLGSTDFTFGYQTAVEIAIDALDKLVTTAESHNRLMILEVMGRDTGWIALAAAIAGGDEIALIPEIPFHSSCIVETVRRWMGSGRGFVIVAVAEGAYPADGDVILFPPCSPWFWHLSRIHLSGYGSISLHPERPSPVMFHPVHNARRKGHIP
jgi:6-phosphofructokinase